MLAELDPPDAQPSDELSSGESHIDREAGLLKLRTIIGLVMAPVMFAVVQSRFTIYMRFT